MDPGSKFWGDTVSVESNQFSLLLFPLGRGDANLLAALVSLSVKRSDFPRCYEDQLCVCVVS